MWGALSDERTGLLVLVCMFLFRKNHGEEKRGLET
jgi:hypothetical protein